MTIYYIVRTVPKVLTVCCLVWYITVMQGCVQNRVELMFGGTTEKICWLLANIVATESGALSLHKSLDIHEIDSSKAVRAEHARSWQGTIIQDLDEGDGGSLILSFITKGNVTCLFADVIKTNESIIEANLEYFDTRAMLIGSMELNRAAGVITDTFRSGSCLTSDDLFILSGKTTRSRM